MVKPAIVPVVVLAVLPVQSMRGVANVVRRIELFHQLHTLYLPLLEYAIYVLVSQTSGIGRIEFANHSQWPNTIKGCFEAPKLGGLLVSESGAPGNVAEVHSAIISGLVTQGIPVEKAREASPWWFPSQQAMKELVEGARFDWIKGEVQLKQTKLTENENGGVEGWIRLFGEPFLGLLPTTKTRDAAVKHAVVVLEAVERQQHEGSFTVNYICIRFFAQKPE
ncbi:unnamed protein product [Penicillium viridicatum]